MKSQSVSSVLALGLALQIGLSPAWAASAAIGTAVTKGPFRLDSATVQGNATLFEGAVLETAAASSSVELNSGARFLLEAASKGRLFGNRMVLEKGESRIERAAGFHVEALGLSIQPQTGTSEGRVALHGGNQVEIAATRGSFRVLNAQGLLVANVATGSALALEPIKGATDSRLTGTPRNQNGRFLLTDETTSVTVELAGTGLEALTGTRVQVNGFADLSAKPAADASHLIRVTQIASLQQNGTRPDGTTDDGTRSSGSAAGSGTPAPAGKSSNPRRRRTPATVIRAAGRTIQNVPPATGAVIGGVAAAGTLGGFAAADKLPGQSNGNTASR